MKRLVAIPLASLCACTVTVAPIKYAQPQPPERKHWWHKHESVAKPAPKPAAKADAKAVPSPAINQIHEQYKPIYEKLPPEHHP